MISRFFLTVAGITFFVLGSVNAWCHPHILDLHTGEEIGFEQLLDDMGDTQLIFIGELHDHDGHHQMQFEVIEGLHRRGEPVAIGLEMFQEDYQGALDKWVAKDISEQGFILTFNQNWSMWPKYQPIFQYAQDENIPMIALNINRNVTRKVARSGFGSLGDEKREELEGVVCEVDPEYEDFIRRALGGHGHGGANFIYFCEAQLLWDVVMARNLVSYLEKFPERKVVVLAGSGHSWKYGIPNQVEELKDLNYKVILPEIPGRIDRTNASKSDADYLWLDFGPDSWNLTDQ